jgi:hypothetical protein
VAVLTVSVLTKLAVSVSLLAPTVKLQGLALPAQVPVVQAVKRLLEPLVAVIVTVSPSSATQLVTLVQPASVSLSVIVTVPLPLAAVLMVAVLAKFAVSVSPEPAEKVHEVVVPLHVPPDQPVKRLPEAAVAVIVIESLTSATQVVVFVQPASESLSVIVAVPLPVPDVAVLIVAVWAKLAVSVSVLAAGKLQALPVVGQVPPVQPVKRLPEPAVSVKVSVSPTSATQVVVLVQPASESLSVTVAVPVPAVEAVIVTVCAKLAVSVSLLDPAVKVQGLALPAQLPVVKPV